MSKTVFLVDFIERVEMIAPDRRLGLKPGLLVVRENASRSKKLATHD